MESVLCDALKEKKKLLFKSGFLGDDFAVPFGSPCGSLTVSVPSVNCWPSESGNSCDINIEYELQEESLELNDVIITIPLP